MYLKLNTYPTDIPWAYLRETCGEFSWASYYTQECFISLISELSTVKKQTNKRSPVHITSVFGLGFFAYFNVWYVTATAEKNKNFIAPWWEIQCIRYQKGKY